MAILRRANKHMHQNMSELGKVGRNIREGPSCPTPRGAGQN
jgi:hypothetical protein